MTGDPGAASPPAAAEASEQPSGAPAPIWPYALLALTLLGVAVAAWRPTPAGVWHDDGVYMMIGKSLSQGDGLRYSGVVDAPPAAKFPPLYPAFLAVLWALTGGIGAVTFLAEILNLGMMAASGALLAWALHVHGKVEQRAAIAAGLLAFVSADVLRIALIPLSEPLFIVILMACLAAWGPATRRDLPRAGALAGLLVLLVLSRTAGAAVVVAFAIALLLRVGVRRALMTIAPSVVVMAAWGAWASRQAREIPDGLSDILGPYMGWLLGQMLGGPVAFISRLPGHALDVGERVAVLVLPGLGGTWLWLAAIPLLAFGLVGARRLHRDLPPVPWIVGTYLLLLLVWPYVDRRLVSPLHPLVVACVIAGAVEAWQRLRPGHIRNAVIGLAILWMGSYTVLSAGRIARGWPVSAYRLRSDALATALESLENTAPSDAVVGAPELWPALHLHGGWTVVPSALFAPGASVEEGPAWGTPERQLDLWSAAGVDHVLLEQAGTIHGATLDLLDVRCPGAVNVLAQMPGQILVRVSWDLCGSGLGR